MKRILTTLSEKWPEYLLEGIVIVGSILLAIWLENQNEDRQDREKQTQYLDRLIADNTQDLEVFQSQISFLMKGITSVETFTASLKSSNTKDSELVQAASQFFKHGSIAPVFNVTRSTYEDLSNTGNLRVITDANVREQLVRYYEYTDLVKERLEINNQWSLKLDGPFQVENKIMQFESSTVHLFPSTSVSDLAQKIRDEKLAYANNAAVHYWINQDAIGEIEKLTVKTKKLIEDLKSVKDK